MNVIRNDFKDSMNYPINGVRTLITKLYEQKDGPEKKTKLQETQKLIDNIKQTFDKVKTNLDNEYSEVLKEVNKSRIELNDVIGFGDHVNGFDVEFKVDENIDFLDVYAAYLGNDYEKMKTNYIKAIEILNETYQLKFEKLKLNEPITEDEINQIFDEKDKETFIRIHSNYILSEQNRTKYKDRISIELPNISNDKIELLDSFIEYKRWLRVQSKAIFRDLEKRKLDLKTKTIKSIEEEIKETEERMTKELELIKQESKVSKLHKNRDQMRVEYEAKLLVIKEIEEEK